MEAFSQTRNCHETYLASDNNYLTDIMIWSGLKWLRYKRQCDLVNGTFNFFVSYEKGRISRSTKQALTFIKSFSSRSLRYIFFWCLRTHFEESIIEINDNRPLERFPKAAAVSLLGKGLTPALT
jgi:hypothetical protein